MPSLSAAPVCERYVRALDLGASQSGNPTAGVKLGKRGDRFAALHVTRFRESVEIRDQRILDTAREDGRQTKILIPQDPGAGGKASADILVKRLSNAGYTVEAKPVSGKKEIRAEAVASQVNAGNVDIVEGAWNFAFAEELRGFPNGANDDQVDALGDAHRELALVNTGKPATAKKSVNTRDTYTPGLRF
jgi:predicted phage terminase large subunit-like protein